MGNYTARSRDNATGNQNTFTQSNVALPRMQSDLNTQGKIRQNNFAGWAGLAVLDCR